MFVTMATRHTWDDNILRIYPQVSSLRIMLTSYDLFGRLASTFLLLVHTFSPAVDRDWLAVACHPITLLLLWGRPWTKQLQRRLQSDVKFPPERHLYGRTRENGSKAPTFRTTPTSNEAIEFLMTIPISLSLSPSFSSSPYNTHHTRNTISVHSFHVIAFRMDDKEFDRILPLDPVSHSAFLQLVGLPS